MLRKAMYFSLATFIFSKCYDPQFRGAKQSLTFLRCSAAYISSSNRNEMFSCHRFRAFDFPRLHLERDRRARFAFH
ncbi:hypothetical protein SISSUDRAFT_637737 [Sistotremastrum suecicum HHB10207 ss-3]|uniref:Uncharacterized protein n=1 Tax=Sistotremastrum suecicum HHB10207 ss-3 TaxID=1314776 RepID=A0A165X7J6_9AGAM|nr:hypothetical protein SISSUDRAFT_637737 [Sistotremastrum suecicum HHB10207 ss-3]